ncbi:DNA primase [Mesomycoplasma hyorhinis]|uniref:DNA primase n=3 Tax=Mesomycoplasma hyorhinis TaxID=2100 RepID=A0AAJ5TBY9_MESHY|nr:DNA primase [Mesomycoplasma hyorhinis]AEC46313.1 DNA primase [Mesomycoplasma hyorhinis MCLD]AEX14191.1 DNA primase [Mesomycoplasma hyorhinis GDL-1]AFX74381.1 DNA primase [Mesomycoplasma hyorhinis SK76]AHA41191.1 DNA primase [Mesomycoplasma hyorhinis DBS 1050]AOD25427.1 DNA primase [Mesomycoplasma hyorhinis]
MLNKEIETIINQVNIFEVISNFINLSKKGNDFLGLCPFHEDSSPSLSVSVSKKIFKCFSCNVGGNVYYFVKRLNNWNDLKTLEYFEKTFNLNLNSSLIAKNVKEFTPNEEKALKALEDAFLFFSLELKQNSPDYLKKYLLQRNLTKEIIDYFSLGYCPKSGIKEKLLKKGHDEAILLNYSLLSFENKTDIFQDRIIFTIKNSEGQIVGFSARKILDSTLGPKYINSSANSLFVKSQILYNYSNAIQYANASKTLIICEGFMDVIAFFRDEVKNVVALMGTALTKDHISYLKPFEIILILDSDQAGIDASLKSISLLLENKISIKVLKRKLEKDPDQYFVTNGKGSLKLELDNTQDAIHWVYKKLSEKIVKNDLKTLDTFIYDFSKYLQHYSINFQNNFIEQAEKDFSIPKASWKLVNRWSSNSRYYYPETTTNNDNLSLIPTSNDLETLGVEPKHPLFQKKVFNISQSEKILLFSLLHKPEFLKIITFFNYQFQTSIFQSYYSELVATNFNLDVIKKVYYNLNASSTIKGKTLKIETSADKIEMLIKTLNIEKQKQKIATLSKLLKNKTSSEQEIKRSISETQKENSLNKNKLQK